jgi:hypothetical protein
MRAQQYAEQIAPLSAAGMPGSEIARRLGVSRQFVSQVRHKFDIYRGPAQPPPIRWPLPRFEVQMKRWLWAAGYRRCICGEWSNEVTVSQRRCPPCNRAQARRRHNSPEGRAYEAKYKKEHPEVMRRAQKKYRQKLMATPEGLEKLRAAGREAVNKHNAKKRAEREAGLGATT